MARPLACVTDDACGRVLASSILAGETYELVFRRNLNPGLPALLMPWNDASDIDLMAMVLPVPVTGHHGPTRTTGILHKSAILTSSFFNLHWFLSQGLSRRLTCQLAARFWAGGQPLLVLL